MTPAELIQFRDMLSKKQKSQPISVCDPTVPKVIIQPHEIEYARLIGTLRESRNRSAGIIDQSGTQQPMNERPDVIGAIGELAVHKLLDRYWDTSVDGPEYDGDALGQIEIKARYEPPNSTFKPRLISSPMNEAKQKIMMDRPFLFVIYHPPHVYFVGWVWGYELLTTENFGDNLNTGRVNWAVSQEVLRPTSELLDTLKITHASVA